MAEVYINGRQLAENSFMLFKDEVWTPEDEEAYSDPANHLDNDLPIQIHSE